MAEEKLHTRKQVAHAAGVSVRTVSRWLAAGKLVGTKPGGATSPVRVERADLDKLIKRS